MFLKRIVNLFGAIALHMASSQDINVTWKRNVWFVFYMNVMSMVYFYFFLGLVVIPLQTDSGKSV